MFLTKKTCQIGSMMHYDPDPLLFTLPRGNRHLGAPTLTHWRNYLLLASHPSSTSELANRLCQKNDNQ